MYGNIPNTVERRALARLSPRLLPVVAVAFSLLVPAAAKATLTPILTETTPASPGTSTQPHIRGSADGVITSAVGRRADPVRTSALEPAATITIYTSSTCTGPVAATGSAEELEGGGIGVHVSPDTTTTFYANQTGVGGTSECSNGISYRQVSSAPPAPVFTGVTPASPADENFPRLRGTADSAAIVYIFNNPDCSGSPVASGTGTEFASPGIEVHVQDNSSSTFFAQASLAGIFSGCSVSKIDYDEVSPTGGGGGGDSGGGSSGGGGGSSNGSAKPPAPRLRTVPGVIANNANPILTGSAPQAVKVLVYTSPDCSGGVVLSGSEAEFDAGIRVPIVPNTSVVLSARSVDSDGDRSACSDPIAYTDDSIAPRTRITLGPGVKTVRRTVVFRFADITGGPETHFLCKLDRKRWKACNAPLRLKHLGHRRHVLKVKAYDAAGNREKRPVKRSFQVVRGF